MRACALLVLFASQSGWASDTKIIPSNFSRVRILSAHNSNNLRGNYLTTVSWGNSMCWPHLDGATSECSHPLWTPKLTHLITIRAFNLHGSICIFCAAFCLINPIQVFSSDCWPACVHPTIYRKGYNSPPRLMFWHLRCICSPHVSVIKALFSLRL